MSFYFQWEKTATLLRHWYLSQKQYHTVFTDSLNLEVAVCKQKAEIWTALNNNKYKEQNWFPDWRKFIWVVKIKLKKESDILLDTNGEDYKGQQLGEPNTPQLLWQNWLVVI